MENPILFMFRAKDPSPSQHRRQMGAQWVYDVMLSTALDITTVGEAGSVTNFQDEMQALSEALHKPSTDERIEEAAKRNAAVRIQRVWRRHVRKQYLAPDFLWSDALTHARMKVYDLSCPVIAAHNSPS